MDEYKKLAKERTELKGIVDTYREWKKKQGELEKAKELLKTETDDEIKSLAREEIRSLRRQQQAGGVAPGRALGKTKTSKKPLP
jgi:protein subunit release factor A